MNTPIFLPTAGSSAIVTSYIYRMYGGRGSSSASHVGCVTDAVLCPISRRQVSGSMELKIESIPEVVTAITGGVTVDRDGPDAYNGMVWRVTFLDNAYTSQALDFDVTLASNAVRTKLNNLASISITRLISGQTYTSCVGTFTVPQGQTLANGQLYYARVLAENKQGYSLPAYALLPQKPMVVPGGPTAVTVSVVSESELRVVFNPPIDDGGDTITAYRIEYATSSDFVNNYARVMVTYLSGGAPFFKKLVGLSTGVYYYIRVSAYNSQGYSDATPTVPSSLNPHRIPFAPTNAYLLVTSDTMLTVTFAPPVSNGGDIITKYRVEWDIAPMFNSVASSPHKGYEDVDATQSIAYTIRYLTKGQKYYTRVYAMNAAGLGDVAITTPAYTTPALQVPGKPQTIAAVTGSTTSGSILVSWQRPSIPAHNIPCGGLLTAIQTCPSTIVGGLPCTDGGTPIIEYAISYNDQADFSGLDNGEITTSQMSYTLQYLVPGRMYYIRVLARNAQGSGSFCKFTETNCLVASTAVMAMAKW